MTPSTHPAPILLLAALLLAAGACGRKGATRPPEDVLPTSIADLEAVPTDKGVALSWARPRNYTGGDRMRDLGGFWVQRADAAGAQFKTITTIEVTDRDRFQQAKKFRYTDSDVESERTYLYRVVSFTLDRYVSAPSNIVVVHNVPAQHSGEPAEAAPE